MVFLEDLNRWLERVRVMLIGSALYFPHNFHFEKSSSALPNLMKRKRKRTFSIPLEHYSYLHVGSLTLPVLSLAVSNLKKRIANEPWLDMRTEKGILNFIPKPELERHVLTYRFNTNFIQGTQLLRPTYLYSHALSSTEAEIR